MVQCMNALVDKVEVPCTQWCALRNMATLFNNISSSINLVPTDVPLPINPSTRAYLTFKAARKFLYRVSIGSNHERKGQLVVCEKGACWLHYCMYASLKEWRYQLQCFQEEVSLQASCEGVTHDNHIVVIDSGKHRRINSTPQTTTWWQDS